MRSRARRLAGPAAILGSLLVAATPTLVEALEAPAGVLFDGRATVVVVGSTGADSGSEMALADAAVTLVATAPNAGPAVLLGDPVMGVTGADGAVTLSGVARPADPGHEVRLAVEATRRTETTDEDGCTRTEVWSGNVAGVAAPPSEPIVVRSELVVATVCATGAVIEGRLLDRAGDPLVVAEASVEVAAPGADAVTIPLALGGDGAFLAELPAVGTWTEPATVTLRATGSTSRDEPFGRECIRTLADAVTWSQPAALAEGATLPTLELTAVEQVIAERCGLMATPPAASAVPATSGQPAPRSQSPAPVAAVSSTPTPVASAAERTPLARAGAVAGRTGVPAPDPTPDPPSSDAGARGATTATPEMVALLVALVTMAVTLVIVIRISRRA